MQAEMSDVLWPHKKPQYRDEELLQQQKKRASSSLQKCNKHVSHVSGSIVNFTLHQFAMAQSCMKTPPRVRSITSRTFNKSNI